MAHRIEILKKADRAARGGSATPVPQCRRLFSVPQAADHAGVPTSTMRHWVKAGRLKAYRLYGGRIRIDEADLIDHLSSQELKWL